MYAKNGGAGVSGFVWRCCAKRLLATLDLSPGVPGDGVNECTNDTVPQPFPGQTKLNSRIAVTAATIIRTILVFTLSSFLEAFVDAPATTGDNSDCHDVRSGCRNGCTFSDDTSSGKHFAHQHSVVESQIAIHYALAA